MMTIEDMPTDVIPIIQEYSSTETDTTAAELSTCRNQRIIGFKDGHTALGFNVIGDYLTLGQGSVNKYARDFRCENMALLRSEDGRTVYGLAYGEVLVMGEPGSYPLPVEPIHLTIGQPCEIPGLFMTEPISQAMLCYRGFQEVQQHIYNRDGDLEVSPFLELASLATAAAYLQYES